MKKAGINIKRKHNEAYDRYRARQAAMGQHLRKKLAGKVIFNKGTYRFAVHGKIGS